MTNRFNLHALSLVFFYVKYLKLIVKRGNFGEKSNRTHLFGQLYSTNYPSLPMI